jgi:flagellar biosynthetic protein FliO
MNRSDVTPMTLFSLIFWQTQMPDSSAAPAAATPPALDMGWLLFKTVLSLALIIGLIVVLVFVLNKYLQQGLKGTPNGDWCRVVAQFPLGQKQSLVLVQTLGKFVLLGVTDSSINKITEFEEMPELQAMAEAAETSGNNMFRKLLQQKLTKSSGN